jgi:transposase
MDGDSTPLGVVIAPADHHEVRHIEALIQTAVVPPPSPCRVLYDAAADSDELRLRLAARGVDLICPHRSNRVRPALQDGRQLRRRRHRWRIERTNAWLHDYGRITLREDRLGSMFLGWVQLACLFTILKRF